MTNGQIIKTLPNGTGIELDYPLYKQSRDHFAVLYWNDSDGDGKGEWIEVSKQLSQSKIPEALTTKSTNELYQLIQTVSNVFYPSLTTDKTGIFILVKK